MRPEFEAKMSIDLECTRKRKSDGSPEIARKIRSPILSEDSGVTSDSHLSSVSSERNCIDKTPRNKSTETGTGSTSKEKPAAAAISGVAPEVDKILRCDPRVVLTREPLIERGLKSSDHKRFSCRVVSLPTARAHSAKPEIKSFQSSEPEATASVLSNSGNRKRVESEVKKSTSLPEIKGSPFSKPAPEMKSFLSTEPEVPASVLSKSGNRKEVEPQMKKSISLPEIKRSAFSKPGNPAPETESFLSSEPELTASVLPKSGNRKEVEPQMKKSVSLPEIKRSAFSKPEMVNSAPEINNLLLFKPETMPDSELEVQETAGFKSVIDNSNSTKVFKPSQPKMSAITPLDLEAGNSLIFDLKSTISVCGQSKSKMPDEQVKIVTPKSFAKPPKTANTCKSTMSTSSTSCSSRIASLRASTSCSIPISRLLKPFNSYFNSVLPAPSLATSSDILNRNSLLSTKIEAPVFSGPLSEASTSSLVCDDTFCLDSELSSSKDVKQILLSRDLTAVSEVKERPTSSPQLLTDAVSSSDAPSDSDFVKSSVPTHGSFSRDTTESISSCMEVHELDSPEKDYSTGILLSNDPRRVIRNSLLQPTGEARVRIFRHVLRKFLINWTEKSRRINKIGRLKDDESSCDEAMDSADLMTTDVPYYTITGCVPPDILNEKEITTDKLEIPSWRHKIFTSCYSMEGTENLSDDVFEKRHARLEQEEKRRKRWDVQRIREQRQLDHLRENERKRNWLAKSDDESDKERQRLCSLYPTVSSDTRISVVESLPVNALGVVLKRFEPREFSLPWKDGNTSCGFSYDKDSCPPKTRRK